MLAPDGSNSDASNSGADKTHYLPYQINRPRNHHYASLPCESLRPLQSRGDVRGDFNLSTGSGRRLLNLLGRCRPWILRLRGNHPFRQRKQDLRHLRDCLVSHCAENKYQPTVFVTLRKGGTQGPGSRGIMRYVEHKLRGWSLSRSFFWQI